MTAEFCRGDLSENCHYEDCEREGRITLNECKWIELAQDRAKLRVVVCRC